MIILIIMSIYVMFAGRMKFSPFSRHYGLKGKVARVAGGVMFVISFGLLLMFHVVPVGHNDYFGYGDTGAIALELILMVVLPFVICRAFVSIYGNAFAETPPSLPLQDAVDKSKDSETPDADA